MCFYSFPSEQNISYTDPRLSKPMKQFKRRTQPKQQPKKITSPIGAVEYAQMYMHKCMICFPNVPVRTLLMPPAEKNIWHRPFPPKLYSLQEIGSVLFLHIYLCLTVITKSHNQIIFLPFSGDP